MVNLKDDHGYLYKRVRLKGIVHLFFGGILLFFPAQAPSLSRTPVLSYLGVNLIGILYITVAAVILIGIFSPNNNYKLARFGMFFGAVFNTIIFLSLFAVFFQSKTTAFFLAIYGYLTYNIWYVALDPGWKVIQTVKRITDERRANRAIV